MRRKIPSIEALIMFEAAARHQSFARAADEVSVTQSAVSRQIAMLEEFLGVTLFNRVKQRVTLTEVGEIYAIQVREHLNRLERDTVATMAYQEAGGTLDLAVIPTFATRWLIPRLPQFYSANPKITLNFTTRPEPFLFTDTPFDAAIHFGDPVWPGAIVEHLFGEELVPICSPALLGRARRLQVHELTNFTLLHQSARPDAWRQWFAVADFDEADAMKGPRYELFSMLVEAARSALGIALVPRFFILKEIATGELLIPCPVSLKSDKGYYLVYPERKQGAPIVQAFSEWLLKAAKQYREEQQAKPQRRKQVRG